MEQPGIACHLVLHCRAPNSLAILIVIGFPKPSATVLAHALRIKPLDEIAMFL